MPGLPVTATIGQREGEGSAPPSSPSPRGGEGWGEGSVLAASAAAPATRRPHLLRDLTMLGLALVIVAATAKQALA